MCSRKYKWPCDLIKHKRQIHEEVKYDCDQCNISFDTQRKLSHHKQKCEKEFPYKDNMWRHQKQLHNKERLHDGESTSKKFKANLEYHCQENEESFQSFSCEKCGMSLSSSKILEMHKVMVHP